MGRRIAGRLWGGAAIAVTWLAIPALASGAYWMLAIIAAIRWRGAPAPGRPATPPPVSILKPVHGRDPHFYEAIRSHAAQDYPEFEILFGISRADDPAADDIRRLIDEFPALPIRLIHSTTKMPNAKVGVLADLAAEARHGVLLVNDSDIRVEPDYLSQITASLNQPDAGLVTCLYRAQSDNTPGQWEALGVATEFAPSVLVARMLGSVEFALGSTMLAACRRPAPHRWLRLHWRLSRRRLPAWPQHSQPRALHRFRGDRGGNALGRRILG